MANTKTRKPLIHKGFRLLELIHDCTTCSVAFIMNIGKVSYFVFIISSLPKLSYCFWDKWGA